MLGFDVSARVPWDDLVLSDEYRSSFSVVPWLVHQYKQNVFDIE